MLEVEWVNGKAFGVIRRFGTDEWTVVRRHITLFGWTDPRMTFKGGGDLGTEHVVPITTAPTKEAAIGYCKLLQED